MNVSTTKSQDIAEDIVCRWYSITRNANVAQEWVVRALIQLIASTLIQKGTDQAVALLMARNVISKWAEECEGIQAESLLAFEALEKKISQIL
jgi:hypothetical protein